ncbi:MAG: BamA/TamA family outer membrane protein [Acidobacteriota bacterium]
MKLSKTLFLAATGLVALSLALPLVAQLGPQYGGRGFGKNKVQYRDFDWKIYHSTHFDVYYYTEEEASLEKVVSFAESAYDRLSREFDYQIQEPTPLIFYATHSAFEQNNIILNFIPEGVGAFASPVRFRMVLPIDLPDDELMNLILHELTHIFQYHILFQGRFGKAIAARPPLWLIEGMASYMAEDETTRDKMFLRDAAVNDIIPPMTSWNGGGFFAYRIGHAVLDYVEETYGKDGFQDFVFELRSSIGSSVGRAVERAFGVEPEDFDADFRRWLRRKYLPELLETGEPRDFGRPFRVTRGLPSQIISPAASPSGDLLAAFTSERGDVDITLFDTKKRRNLRNLTKGFSSDYQYLVAQELTLGRKFGRDLAFSPDGNTIAVFAKRERNRSLLLVDALNGKVRKRLDLDHLDQHLAPAWHPDGRRLAFSAIKDGAFDIYIVDTETGEVENFTQDSFFDAAPTFSPDGKSLVMTTVIGEGHAKLFRIPLDDPSKRFQLTFGDWSETDPIFSPTGRRLYFTSDRTGVENIFGLDLESGELHQYTNAVTGCFMPTVLPQADGTERLVYTAMWKGRFDLYAIEVPEPVVETETVQIASEASDPEALPVFEPDIQVPIDDSNIEDYGGFKLFLEGADAVVGIDDDQTLLGQIVLSFTDYLGDQRVIAVLSSVESLSNFDITYINLKNRWQWQVNLFDDRLFYRTFDDFRGVERGDSAYEQRGAVFSVVYPFTFQTRFEVGAGYVFREFDQVVQVFDPELGPGTGIVRVEDDFPIFNLAFAGDSSAFNETGPVSGRRWRLDFSYALDTEESGSLFTSTELEVRQYLPVTRRSGFALRGFFGVSDGNQPGLFALGGLDNLRGFDFRSLVGTHAFVTNIEYRFPLIDVLATPILGFQGIRGIIFLDVGGAWFDEFEDFDIWDSDNDQFADARASYGYGISARFAGLTINWDFARQYRFDLAEEGFKTDFWIGTRF